MRVEMEGAIISVGFASGDRFVVGRWRQSPVLPMTDVMWARPDGERVLLAPDGAVARFVSGVYRFERVEVVPFTVNDGSRRLDLVAGDLHLRLEAGRGLPLPLPRGRPPWFTRRVEGPVARALLGVRTYGVSPTGVREWYRADRWRPVVRASASLGGVDLGAPGPLRPALRVGFSEPPRRPSWVEVRPLLVDDTGALAAALGQHA